MTPEITSDVTVFLQKFGTTKTFGSGDILIRQGTVSQTVNILLAGTAEIIKSDSSGRKSVIAIAKKGDIFGEMSVFLNLRRSATIRASSPGIFLEFTNRNFLEAVINIPFLTLRVIKSLCSKLSELNQKYVKEANRNNILFVGIHLIEQMSGIEQNIQQLQIDTTGLVKKTSIKLPDIIVVLNKLKTADVIDNLIYDKDKNAIFVINLKLLRNFLKSLAFK